MFHYLPNLFRGIQQIVFPDICICCGQEALQHGRHLCPFCLEKRFEHPDLQTPRRTGDTMLPDTVQMQYALWKFDKGGMLQNLTHQLKYEHLTGIGHQLGEVLARRLIQQGIVETADNEQQTMLVPVPLHYLKFRKRGFNQAFSIARGIRNVTGTPICPIDAVRRTKYTRTQTGFSRKQRIDNMKDAFSVNKPDQLKNKKLIIIDDVFTTGATSFELARTLFLTSASLISIWTVAQA